MGGLTEHQKRPHRKSVDVEGGKKKVGQKIGQPNRNIECHPLQEAQGEKKGGCRTDGRKGTGALEQRAARKLREKKGSYEKK